MPKKIYLIAIFYVFAVGGFSAVLIQPTQATGNYCESHPDLGSFNGGTSTQFYSGFPNANECHTACNNYMDLHSYSGIWYFSNQKSPTECGCVVGASNPIYDGNTPGGACPIPSRPSAPQNVSAIANQNQITVSWSAPASDGGSTVFRYEIYRNTGNGGYAHRATVNSSTIFSYTDNVVYNTTYFYKITATNSNGEGPYSNEVSATTGASPTPTSTSCGYAPINLVGAFIDNPPNAHLTWQRDPKCSSSGGYEIDRFDGINGDTFFYTSDTFYDDSYFITAGRTYYYTVREVTPAKIPVSGYSNQVSWTPSSPSVAPSITTQPTSQTVTEGQTAIFSVTASGSAPLQYKWWKFQGASQNPIPGETSSSYTIPSVTTADSGSRFYVTVSNGNGSRDSNLATLTVNASSSSYCGYDPNANACTGNDVNSSTTLSAYSQCQTFCSNVFGPSSGQGCWEYNSARVCSCTNGTTVAGGNNGYTGAGLCGATSPIPPTITTQPADQTAIAGSTATFTVTASGTAPLTYQWQRGWVNGNQPGFSDITGATNSSYTTPATSQDIPRNGTNQNNFRVIVTNNYGNVTSRTAVLTVNPTAQPGQCSNPQNPYDCSSPAASTNRVDGANSWTWTCPGSNGGSSAQCSKAKPAPPSCRPDQVLIQGSCVCPAGTSGNPCVSSQPPSCRADQVLIQGNCVCPAGQSGNPCSADGIGIPNPIGANSLNAIINNITFWFYVFSVPILGLILLYGAFLIATSAGEEEKYNKGKKILKWGILGFVLVLLSGAIAAIIRAVVS